MSDTQTLVEDKQADTLVEHREQEDTPVALVEDTELAAPEEDTPVAPEEDMELLELVANTALAVPPDNKVEEQAVGHWKLTPVFHKHSLFPDKDFRSPC